MIDVQGIMDVLPHRYPFLFVDRIVELDEGKRIVGIKNVSINEPFFQGHFPNNPIMPGVLIVEAMAQVAGILAFRSGVSGSSIYFMSIEKAKFRKPVFPGDQLRLEIKVTHKRNNVWKFFGETFVNNKLVSESEFTAMVSAQELEK